MIEAKTHGGKTIQLIPDRRHTAYKFQFVPGGELPEDLSGIFMDERAAKVALARYLERTKPKENAKR